MNKSIKINVYEKRVEVQKTSAGWVVYFLGNDGKKRLANDIVIPSFITEEEMECYLSDLCHEWATDNNSVYKLG